MTIPSIGASMVRLWLSSGSPGSPRLVSRLLIPGEDRNAVPRYSFGLGTITCPFA